MNYKLKMPIYNNVKKEVICMNKEIAQYKQDKWNKIINKIKILFWSDVSNMAQSGTILNNDSINEIKESYEKEKKKFAELVIKLESGNITEMDLEMYELKILTQYYEQENSKLDKIIENQNRKIDKLNLELNKAYEKAIKLKA